MSDVLKSYYIGDPEYPHKIGQDKNGYVECLLWLMIYKKGAFFASPTEHSLGCSGSGIGKAKTIPAAREKLHEYAINTLTAEKHKTIDELKRINAALDKLGDDPANLEQFVGNYK